MKTVEEVDLQVRELSRGGNPASRGVLFANKYIQISKYHVFLCFLENPISYRCQYGTFFLEMGHFCAEDYHVISTR